MTLRLSTRSVPVILGLCGLPAVAEELPVPPVPAIAGLTPAPHRLGYAFDRPQILLRQRLFGIAHGAAMLGAACLESTDHLAASTYEDWRQGQAVTIDRIRNDLARWYFGTRAAEADWSDVARAIGLREQLDPRPAAELADACRTLPEALSNPRYDFATLIKGDGQVVVEPRAVPPVPKRGFPSVTPTFSPAPDAATVNATHD